MRIAILTDVHGNLPALETALAAIDREGCDAIYHTGDAIGIGPYPAECLDRLLHTRRVRCVMGNHDAWFAHGLPQPQPSWRSDGELAHQRWVHAALDPALRPVVARRRYAVDEEWAGIRCTFLHYVPSTSAASLSGSSSGAHSFAGEWLRPPYPALIDGAPEVRSARTPLPASPSSIDASLGASPKLAVPDDAPRGAERMHASRVATSSTVLS